MCVCVCERSLRIGIGCVLRQGHSVDPVLSRARAAATSLADLHILKIKQNVMSNSSSCGRCVSVTSWCVWCHGGAKRWRGNSHYVFRAGVLWLLTQAPLNRRDSSRSKGSSTSIKSMLRDLASRVVLCGAFSASMRCAPLPHSTRVTTNHQSCCHSMSRGDCVCICSLLLWLLPLVSWSLQSHEMCIPKRPSCPDIAMCMQPRAAVGTWASEMS